MKNYTIIWDFDGTLLPNDPYDSEQSLMMYKLHEAGEKIPVYIKYARKNYHFVKSLAEILDIVKAC